jgi:DNA repair exonuclease SbcCD ATPase subunit
MKAKNCFLLLGLGAASLFSCGKSGKDYKALKAENDSLKIENLRTAAELNDILSILDEVENDIQTIRTTENVLVLPPSEGEITPSKREELRQNMEYVTSILQKNRQQIANLEERIKQDNVRFAALRKTVDRLNTEIAAKVTLITTLQEDLAKKNVRIESLDKQVAALSQDVKALSRTNTEQSQQLTQKDKELHTAYYCFGTKKELKEQRILTGGGLFAKSKTLEKDFNRDYFVTVDTREVTEIPLFTDKASVKSTHPADSYRFDESKKGDLTLVITDADTFWSLSRYLVIQIK